LPSNIKDKKIIQNEISNNWFKTFYYEKELNEGENEKILEDKSTKKDTKKRNAITDIDTNNKKKKNSIEEDKSKSSFYPGNSKEQSSSQNKETYQRKSKKTSSVGFESKSSLSGLTSKEIESKFISQTKSIIEEEDSESFTDPIYSEPSEKKTSEELDEGNTPIFCKYSVGKS
jgi:hypothetical protein